MKIVCCHRVAGEGIGYDDPAQSAFQVCKVICQTEDRHDLRCDGDHKMIFSDHTIHLASKSHHNVP